MLTERHWETAALKRVLRQIAADANAVAESAVIIAAESAAAADDIGDEDNFEFEAFHTSSLSSSSNKTAESDKTAESSANSTVLADKILFELSDDMYLRRSKLIKLRILD